MNSTTWPELDAIIPTLARPADIAALLDCLATHDCLPGAVVVVDQSDDDRTKSEVTHRMSSYPCKLEYFRRKVKSLTAARNFGLEQTNGEYVLFLDDDVLLEPGFLTKIKTVYQADEQCDTVGVAGRIVNERVKPSARWRIRKHLRMVPHLKGATYLRSGVCIPHSFLTGSEGSQPVDFLPGGLTVWRRSVFRACRYDENLSGYGNGEDLSFSLRARTEGRLVVINDAWVKHALTPSGRPNVRALGKQTVMNMNYIHHTKPGGRSRWDFAHFLKFYTLDIFLDIACMILSRQRSYYRAFAAGKIVGLWLVGTGQDPRLTSSTRKVSLMRSPQNPDPR